jgi:endoglucanase
MCERGYWRSGRERLDVTDAVTPNDRSRMRHLRDDEVYVRRLSDPATGPVAQATTLTDASRQPDDAAASDRPPRTTRRRPGTPPPARPPASAPPAPRRHSGLILLVTIIVVALGAGATAWWAMANSTDHVFDGRALYVDPNSSAAIAAETSASAAERAAANEIAAQPTGIWLTPERDPAGEVASKVRSIVIASKSAVPVFVVYGITDRDCGGQSAGGLEPDAYLEWVDEVAGAIGQRTAVVVLEPDALALAPECGDVEGRTELVREAFAHLEPTGAIVYLDGGHSSWLPVDEMAELLRAAGIDRARGFATNVSNTRATDAEFAYAEDVSAAVGGAHAVIDTSRNGNGPPADAEWCNPSGRILGDVPAVVDDPVVDALLWIKPPGESDGRCNGGPAAGDWWPERAIELAGTG